MVMIRKIRPVVSGGNTIALPKTIMKHLNLTKDDSIQFEIKENGEVIIKKSEGRKSNES